MSKAAISWADKQPWRSFAERSIMGVLAKAVNDAGQCWLSQITIAERLNCSVRYVQTLLARLELRGVLKRRKRSAGHNGRLSDLITLAVGNPVQVAKAIISTAKVKLRDAARHALRSLRLSAKRNRSFATRTPDRGIKHSPSQDKQEPPHRRERPRDAQAPGWAYACAKGLVDGSPPLDGTSCFARVGRVAC